MDVHYLPIAYDNSFGFVKRSFSFMQFAFRSYSIAKKIKDISVCYAISVPLTIGFPAIWLKRTKKIPFVFEVGDLWPDAPIQLGFIKNSVLIKVLFAFEKWIYREADSIVALSTQQEESISKRINEKKIHLIPNMADCDFYFPSQKTKNQFVVSYIGAAGFANGLDYFIECARNSAKANLPIHFILCGEGAMLEHLKSSAQRLNLTNIIFKGLVNRQEVKEIMDASDAIFVCYKNVPILETGSPNKYFDGLAAGKLIMTNFGGWIKNEIEENKCGVALDPRHPSDFVKKIQPFVQDSNLLTQYQVAARQLAEKNYNRAKLSKTFAAIFQKYSSVQ